MSRFFHMHHCRLFYTPYTVSNRSFSDLAKGSIASLRTFLQHYFLHVLINVVTDSMDVMACFFQGWPVSAGVNFQCIQP